MERSKPAAVKVARRIRPFGETRMRVIKLHQDNPDLGITEIARICGVTRQRIDQIGDELGLVFKARHGKQAFDVTVPRVPAPEDVRAWRRDHGDLTQAVLADLLGVSKDTVARWERAMRPAPAMLTVAFEALKRRSRLDEPFS